MREDETGTEPDDGAADGPTARADEASRRDRADPTLDEGTDRPTGGEPDPAIEENGDRGNASTESDRIPIDADDRRSGDPPRPEPNSTVIEAESPSLENVAFVLLGVIAMLLVIVRLVSIGLG